MLKLLSITMCRDGKLLASVLGCMGEVFERLRVGRQAGARLCAVLNDFCTLRMAGDYERRKGECLLELSVSGRLLRIALTDQGSPYWVCGKNAISDGKDFLLDLSPLQDAQVKYGLEFTAKKGPTLYFEVFMPRPFGASRPVQAVFSPLDTDFRLYALGPDERDIVEAIGCIYDEYGFSYGNEQLYCVDKFKSSLATDEFLAFLIKNQHGQVAGYQAMRCVLLFPGMLMLSTCVIKHAFRKHGLATLALDQAMKKAKDFGVRGVLAHPAAYHTYTQRLGGSRGFVATGILLNYIHDDLQSEFNRLGVRLHLAVATRMLNTGEVFPIYPPLRHRHFFENLFNKLGMIAQCKKSLPAREEYSHTRLEGKKVLQSVLLFVSRVGRDFGNQLGLVLRESLTAGNKMTVLYINLRDPACGEAFRAARRRGFYFSGGALGARNMDYLIMQHYMGLPICRESIKTEGDYTDILEYCQRFMPAELFV